MGSRKRQNWQQRSPQGEGKKSTDENAGSASAAKCSQGSLRCGKPPRAKLRVGERKQQRERSEQTLSPYDRCHLFACSRLAGMSVIFGCDPLLDDGPVCR